MSRLPEGPLSWMGIAMVLSYSRYAVYVPSRKFLCGDMRLLGDNDNVVLEQGVVGIGV